jgi:hypothetical protein
MLIHAVVLPVVELAPTALAGTLLPGQQLDLHAGDVVYLHGPSWETRAFSRACAGAVIGPVDANMAIRAGSVTDYVTVRGAFSYSVLQASAVAGSAFPPRALVFSIEPCVNNTCLNRRMFFHGVFDTVDLVVCDTACGCEASGPAAPEQIGAPYAIAGCLSEAIEAVCPVAYPDAVSWTTMGFSALGVVVGVVGVIAKFRKRRRKGGITVLPGGGLCDHR